MQLDKIWGMLIEVTNVFLAIRLTFRDHCPPRLLLALDEFLAKTSKLAANLLLHLESWFQTQVEGTL
jgi:hypothetical protein